MFTLSFLFCFCSLKLECEKLASEKTEMQRHYVMVGIRARGTFSHYVILCVSLLQTGGNDMLGSFFYSIMKCHMD